MGHVPGWFGRCHGGDMVPEGVFWNLSTLKFIPVKGTVDFLPGKRETSYLRVPTFVVPIIALLLSFFYLIALTLAPIVLIGWLGGRGAATAFRHLRMWRFAVNWN